MAFTPLFDLVKISLYTNASPLSQANRHVNATLETLENSTGPIGTIVLSNKRTILSRTTLYRQRSQSSQHAVPDHGFINIK